MNSVVTLSIKKMNKTIITIFGSTGDLALRKLLPALQTLIVEKADNEDFTIIAVGRRPYQSEDYLNFINNSDAFSGDINVLRPHLIYLEVEAADPQAYMPLKLLLETLGRGREVRELFYLAVGPSLFLTIAHNLAKLKIVTKQNKQKLIAFEKPFGHTFDEAEEINAELEKVFSAQQIYRVDHYLGKEIIQNLLSFRFSNTITQALWHKKYIKEVKIVVSESAGILNRGAYYDQVGVLNDMVQSHLLQVLALLVMDAPKSLASAHVQQAKINALKKVRYVAESSFLGQYRGYQQEKGVEPTSPISTMAFLTMFVDKKELADVPFYLYTGKKLARQEAYIEILFHESSAANLFSGQTPNTLLIEIAPFSRYRVLLNSREETSSNNLTQIELEHCFNCVFPSPVKEAYVHLFTEMKNGRSMLFPSFAEIKASWNIIEQIRRNKPRYLVYEPGFDIKEA